jgi:transposase
VTRRPSSVGGSRTGRASKKARRLNATIAFLDESGFMLQPLVRRSWAPRGQTPILRCWDRRDRLSVIGAITVPPGRERYRLSAVFRIHTRNVRTPEATEFLRILDRQAHGSLVVVLDLLNVHRAAVKRWLASRRPEAPRVAVEWLPPYAPDLNPAEQLWNNGKRTDLANLAPTNRDDLRGHVHRSLIRQRCSPDLLAAAFDHAGLPL